MPLIIAGPGVDGSGNECARPVELVDLYPTIADLCGLAPPEDLEGASLRPLLENPGAAWDRPAFTQVNRRGVPGHSVRTERWRYIEWANGREGVQLYDHEADQRELRNLAGDPRYAATLEELRELVQANWPEDSYSNGSAAGGRERGRKKARARGGR